MPSIKPILRTDKLKSNGEAPLYVRVIDDRTPKYKSLGIALEPKYWDEDKGKVKTSHPSSVRMNHLILEKIRLVNEAVIDSELQPEKVNALDILRHRSTGFLQYANSFMIRREKINKLGMLRRMNSVISKVEAFMGGTDVGMNSLNMQWLHRYEHHLLNRLGNSPNTVASNMSGLRTIFNEAEREGILKRGQNPFDHYIIRKKEAEIEFLTDDELEQIKSFDLPNGTKMAQHRDMFVFACYTAGIRISDLLTLKWKNFDGERLSFTTRKTNLQMNIKLGETALEIIGRLECSENPDGFIFGFLPEGIDTKDEKQMLSAISSATAYVNKNLSKLSERTGLDKHLHFHMSRHTWATRMLRRGMRIEHVSKLLGHKSIRTTQVYAKIVNADLDDAIDKFND